MAGLPRPVEMLVGIFIPPACREEVLGDLHERYRGPLAYLGDVLSTVPLVIVSRIRRTTDFQVLLMEACALYLSFWGAARLGNAARLDESLGLLRLAIPAAAALVAVILYDAYATPGRRSATKAVRAPVFGLAAALLSQATLAARSPELTLPGFTLWAGACTGLLLVTGLRMLFPPVADRPQGASGPAFWLQQTSEPLVLSPGAIRLAKAAGIVAVAALLLALAGYRIR